MSEQNFTRKRSRRLPASEDETDAASGFLLDGPFEETPPEGGEPSADPEPEPVPAPEAPAPGDAFEEPKPAAIDSPVNPKSTISYRLALGAVILLGVLIVAGVGFLLFGLMNYQGRKAAAPVKPVSMSLAPGYRILSNDTQPGRLILHVRSETKDEIDIIDLDDGHVVAQIHAEAPK